MMEHCREERAWHRQHTSLKAEELPIARSAMCGPSVRKCPPASGAADGTRAKVAMLERPGCALRRYEGWGWPGMLAEFGADFALGSRLISSAEYVETRNGTR